MSVERHTKRRQIELAEALAGRKAIFLDLCFWIRMRDAIRFGESNEATKLVDQLRCAVASGRAFCPISDGTFLEIYKQADKDSRLATAALVDELSLGVTLIPSDLRVGTEIAHLVHSARSPGQVHELRELVWSKLSYVMGYSHPTNSAFDEATNLALQKAFLDHMWDNVSLIDICTQIGEDFVSSDPLGHRGTAERINAETKRHAPTITSFKQVYEHEIAGVLDLYAPRLASILAGMRPAGTELPPPGSAEDVEIERQCLSMLIAVLRTDKGKKAIRTLHIESLLHASVRWNKTQIFQVNDFFDFRHASAAVGYCDAFFTDGPLHDALSKKTLGLEQMFGCFVASDFSDAIRYVAELNSTSEHAGPKQ